MGQVASKIGQHVEPRGEEQSWVAQGLHIHGAPVWVCRWSCGCHGLVWIQDRNTSPHYGVGLEFEEQRLSSGWGKAQTVEAGSGA